MKHPIEEQQEKLYEELPAGATVLETVAILLGLDAGDETEHLIVRQLVEADRHVERYVPAMRSVRRAATGCGFVAGMTFTLATLRAHQARRQEEETEHELDDREVAELLPKLAKAIESCTPDRLGFALLLFEFDGESMFYVSSARRDGMIKALQEFIRHQKAKGR